MSAYSGGAWNIGSAPSDGKIYGMKNGIWVVLAGINRWVLDVITDPGLVAVWDDSKLWDDAMKWEEV